MNRQKSIAKGSDKNLLFVAYPSLRGKLSYSHFADLPTPIHECKNLNKQLNINLFVKQDGLSGSYDERGHRLVGGNKVRKLQYFLADALAQQCSTVITLGYSGSNHALQTAVYAQLLGLKCITILKPQPNSPIVRQNLLLQKAFGAHMLSTNFCRSLREFPVEVLLELKKQEEGKLPYLIPLGGSSALGSLGFVEAVFELQEQIRQNLLPNPDHIYITLGSGGTAAGLLVGIKLAGLRTKVHLVIDEPEDVPGFMEHITTQLFEETAALLHDLDSNIPLVHLSKDDYIIDSSHTGSGYGVETSECRTAMKLIKEQENITLDQTYTGKCFAALCADAKEKCIAGTVLFWNTFCGEDMSTITSTIDYHSLPQAFHGYFE
jgi:D-cysteine desulfhydrase